jgi:hypothetical protein
MISPSAAAIQEHCNSLNHLNRLHIVLSLSSALGGCCEKKWRYTSRIQTFISVGSRLPQKLYGIAWIAVGSAVGGSVQ